MIPAVASGGIIRFRTARRGIVLIIQNCGRSQPYRPNGTRNDVGVAISDMTFSVKFKDLPGGPEKIIVEHRQK